MLYGAKRWATPSFLFALFFPSGPARPGRRGPVSYEPPPPVPHHLLTANTAWCFLGLWLWGTRTRATGPRRDSSCGHQTGLWVGRVGVDVNVCVLECACALSALVWVLGVNVHLQMHVIPGGGPFIITVWNGVTGGKSVLCRGGAHLALWPILNCFGKACDDGWRWRRRCRGSTQAPCAITSVVALPRGHVQDVKTCSDFRTVFELCLLNFDAILVWYVADCAWFDPKTRQRSQINALDLCAAWLQRPFIWRDVALRVVLSVFLVSKKKFPSNVRRIILDKSCCVLDLQTPFFSHYLNCLMEHSADHICVQHLYHVN